MGNREGCVWNYERMVVDYCIDLLDQPHGAALPEKEQDHHQNNSLEETLTDKRSC